MSFAEVVILPPPQPFLTSKCIQQSLIVTELYGMNGHTISAGVTQCKLQNAILA